MALDQEIPGSNPGGPIESSEVKGSVVGAGVGADSFTFSFSEGWPSGLRRRPAKALGRKALVGSNPTPSVSPGTGGRAAQGARLESVWAPRVPRGFESHPVRSHATSFLLRDSSRGRGAARRLSEGWQNGNAPVSKTGALTGLRVRIPPPPPYHPVDSSGSGEKGPGAPDDQRQFRTSARFPNRTGFSRRGTVTIATGAVNACDVRHPIPGDTSVTMA